MNRVFHALLSLICSLNTLIHVRSFGLLQELSELVHHVCFMLHKGMGIAIERDGWVLVTEDLGERLYVHTTFKRVRSKRKPTKNYRIKSAKIQYLKKVDTNCVHLF